MLTIEQAKNVVIKCGGQTKLHKRGAGWVYLFVLDSTGCQIGRITFNCGNFYGTKSYKRSYFKDLCESDFIFLKLDKFIKDKFFISNVEIYKLWEEACCEVKEDLEKFREWRKNNPSKRKRSKLTGKNPRSILYKKVYNYER